MGVIRTPFVSGTTLNNPLAIGDTSLSSLGLGGLAAIVSPDIAKIVLDPAGAAGNPEVVYVTAHTAAATTATISRAAEGSTARAHLVGTPWIVGPTSLDFGWTSTPATATAYNPNPEFLVPHLSPGVNAQTNSVLGVASRAKLQPIQPLASDVTVKRLLTSIGVQSGNVDVGIYMFDGTTMTRIVSLGTTACPAAATAVAFDITDTVLYRGTRYFFAFAADNNTVTFGQGTASVLVLTVGYIKAASFPLPATITGLTSAGNDLLMAGELTGGSVLL